jgi:large subunit ribosomal protein L6
MSRIGKKVVAVPSGITVQVTGQDFSVSGPKGSCRWSCPKTTEIAFDQGARQIRVTARDHSKQSRANHGLARALVANMIRGVSVGFERRLKVYGTGYNCKLQGRVLHLNVGYSGQRRGVGSQFEIPVPEGLEVAVEVPAARGDNEPAQFVIRGVDKQKVGQFAAEVRSLRKTEPYKGKGIRYEDEVVRKKQGKALTSGGG